MNKAFIICALFFGISTFAQTKGDKIKELISLSGAFTISKEVKKNFISEYKKRYSHVPDLAWKPIEENINIDELVDKVVEIYGVKFNEKEIDQLLIFYKSDVGKKVIQNTPTMATEIQDATRNWAAKINKTINNDLEKMGYLQSPPPPMPSSK